MPAFTTRKPWLCSAGDGYAHPSVPGGGLNDDRDDDNNNPFEGFRIEIDPEKVEQTMRDLRERVESRVREGRYTKVRLSYKGKAMGPDIPLGVLLAGEGIAFWLMSPIAALLVNLGAKAILDVEFIHEADQLVSEGVELYLAGDVEEAEAKYREALGRRDDDPSAMYNLGVLLRVTGRKEEAMSVLRQAAMGTEGHPDVIKSAELLDRMQGKRTL
jgi:tetratricopeptide (TPR) repeat protein